MPTHLPRFLATVAPFRHLPDAERQRLEGEVEVIQATPGHVFFEEGADSDEVFVARTGRVRIQHFRPDGSVRTVCVIGAGETFCCLPALDGGTYPATATAAEPSVVYRVPGESFRRLVETHPEFARATMRHFCGRLREAGCEGCARSDDAPARLAGKLLAMADKFGSPVPVTRKELGELAGTTVETAIRATREFEELGWVVLARGKITIEDRAALKRRADGLPQPATFPAPRHRGTE
jgi:CRP/FNR family transcriptional regulator